MKLLYTLTLFSFTTFNAAAQLKDHLVIEDRLLTWDDFNGRHKSDAFDALTSYIIIVEPRTYKPGDPIPEYKATAYFMSKESSVDKKFLKERSEDDKLHLLKHEQGHYDLSRIAARQINDIYKSFNFHPRRSIYQSDSIQRSINNKMRLTQLKYDKETNHSKIKTEQEKWNKLISEALHKKQLPE